MNLFTSEFYVQADALHAELQSLYRKRPSLRPNIFDAFARLAVEASFASEAADAFGEALRRYGGAK